jgi:hypothetical protein
MEGVMKRMIMLMLSGWMSLGHAWADDGPATATPPVKMTEPSPAKQWLELQRSGKAASVQAQPISGEVMDRVHKRYLKSFENPIPEFYEQIPANR